MHGAAQSQARALHQRGFARLDPSLAPLMAGWHPCRVRLGEIIVEVDSQRITGLTDVRQLLVNSNPEVTLVLQQPGQSLTSGLFGFAGMGSLRLGGEAPRRVTIRRSGAPAAGGARRARQPEEARAEEVRALALSPQEDIPALPHSGWLTDCS